MKMKQCKLIKNESALARLVVCTTTEADSVKEFFRMVQQSFTERRHFDQVCKLFYTTHPITWDSLVDLCEIISDDMKTSDENKIKITTGKYDFVFQQNYIGYMCELIYNAQ